MGQLNYTTAKTNELLAKIEGFPENVTDGKTPVFVIGTVSTLDPGMSATASVTKDGVDDQGNPKYKLNLGIPKGLDGGSSGGGGVADSVQWANVLNKPSWIGSTKPTYTASEVGALPSSTQIPSKTSDLTNDSGFTTASSFKTVNGQSIVGSGNIAIGSGLGDAPSDGKTYGRKNGAWAEVSTTGGIDEGQLAKYLTNNHYLNTESPLTGYMKASAYTALADTDTLNVALGKLEAGIGSGGTGGGDDTYYLPIEVNDLKAGATEEDIRTAFGGDDGINGVQEAINAGKKIFIKKEGSIATYIAPVNGFVFLKGTAFLLSFVHLSTPSIVNMFILIIDWNASEKTVKIIYPDGYILDQSIYWLT